MSPKCRQPYSSITSRLCSKVSGPFDGGIDEFQVAGIRIVGLRCQIRQGAAGAIPFGGGSDKGRFAEPGQGLFRGIASWRTKQDGEVMRLLFAALEFMDIGILPGKQTQDNGVARCLNRLGEILPEARNGHAQGSAPGANKNCWSRPLAGALHCAGLQAIAAKRVRNDMLAVEMVAAFPVNAAARILVQLERSRHLLEWA